MGSCGKNQQGGAEKRLKAPAGRNGKKTEHGWREEKEELRDEALKGTGSPLGNDAAQKRA